jgi:hypothetical protein
LGVSCNQEKRHALPQDAIVSSHLLIIINVPVVAYVCPARIESLTAKVADLSEVTSSTFIFLPLSDEVIVRCTNQFAIMTPADVANFTCVAVYKGRAIAEDWDCRGAGFGAGVG